MLTAQQEQIQQRFLAFSEREAKNISPLYAVLSHSIANDRELLELATHVPEGQPVPNLLFSAVHYLLQSKYGTDPLAIFYADLTPAPAPVADSFPAFQIFCRKHASAIQELLQTRLVQTNEVRRSAILLPGIATVLQAVSPARPLALIEIGSSAGLNLLLDRWQYHYTDTCTWGSEAAPVSLRCELRGERVPPLPPEPPLPIVNRNGLDRNPVDVRDPDAIRWLRALIWPEQAERFALLDAAVVAARIDPPTLVAGNALETLPAAFQQMPSDATLCVFHSFTVNQFSREMREKLEILLQAEAERRGTTVHRLALEGAPNEPYPLLRHLRYRPGQEREATLLARCDPHGAWLEWLTDPVR